MRRLTLILSDLYLPEGAAGEARQTRALDLPNLDWLLRFADPPRRIADWRCWLAAQLVEATLADRPIARACAMATLNQDSDTAWLATPVHLEARLDHVRLVDRGLLRLEAEQRLECCQEFALAFGPQYALHDLGERAFLLTGIAPTSATTRDPARLLDSDIGAALPQGRGAAELRRLGTEIEMWLHRARFNERRDQARKMRITTFWIWGGGARQAQAAAAHSGSIEARAAPQLRGGDPYLCALANSFADAPQRGLQPAPAPAAYGDIPSGTGEAVIELCPMTGPESESLHALDANWFAPVRAALEQGALAACDLLANDRHFHIRPRPSWKFWRRHDSWLHRLGSG